MINLSFQNVPDVRSAASWGVSGAVGVALLVSLTVLTYFEYLPEYGYYIAGGACASSLLIGACAATLREQVIEAAKKPAPNPIENPVAEPEVEQIPPFEQIYKTDSQITLDVSPVKILPPDQDWPFVSALFQFKVEGWEYGLRVAQFVEEGDKLYALIVSEGNYFACKKIQVVQEEGWNNAPPSASIKRDRLNESIKKDGYLSLSDARAIQKYQSSGKAGYFFRRRERAGYLDPNAPDKKTTEMNFTIPGLDPGLDGCKISGDTVFFNVDTGIYAHQSELLKQYFSAPAQRDHWIHGVVDQLRSSTWTLLLNKCDSIEVSRSKSNRNDVTITIQQTVKQTES